MDVYHPVGHAYNGDDRGTYFRLQKSVELLLNNTYDARVRLHTLTLFVQMYEFFRASNSRNLDIASQRKHIF